MCYTPYDEPGEHIVPLSTNMYAAPRILVSLPPKFNYISYFEGNML